MFRRIFLIVLAGMKASSAGDILPPSLQAPIIAQEMARFDGTPLAAQLLSPTLAASVLGGNRLAPDLCGTLAWSQPGHKISQVSYSTGEPAGLRLSLMVRHAATLEENNYLYEKAKAARQAAPVPGLGEDAFFTTDHVLHIRSGRDWLVITANNHGLPDLGLQEEASFGILKALRH